MFNALLQVLSMLINRAKKKSMNSLNMLNDLAYKYDCLMLNAITQSITSTYDYFK